MKVLQFIVAFVAATIVVGISMVFGFGFLGFFI